MKSRNYSPRSSIITGLALALALATYAPSVHANVYATNIKLNGSLTGTTSAAGSPVTITYILNENATTGVTIQILTVPGNTVVSTINVPAYPAAGANVMGLNSVIWPGTAPVGTYSVSITAAASGYTVWTQTSIDSNPGMPAHYPLGIDVDKNTTSPFYGRVVMGCAIHTGTVNVPPAAMQTGLFKMNADGSQADEGWYGNANYLADDGGDGAVAGQMPDSGGYDPMKIRIGDDDRIYWVDNSYYGSIIATDMQATTNQVVITEGFVGNLGGPYNYSGNPDKGDLGAGFQEFDVTCGITTPYAALYLPDNDYPNWGIWMYRLTNAVAGAGLVADPNDTVGIQVVETGGDIALVTAGGCMVDNALDVFVGQDRNNINSVYDAMVFTNWNGGILPPEGTDPNGSGPFGYVTGTAAGQVYWGFGDSLNSQNQVALSDSTFEGLRDVVIDSRSNPTFVACPCSIGSQSTPGIRVLNATNNVGKTFWGTVGDVAGQLVTVTNGSGTVIQTLTNIDWGQAYTCAAWDNVGNLYAASTTRNLWRVWSPPGPNTNTTVAVGQVTLTQPLLITSITVVGTTVTIHFTGPASAAASAFTLYSSGSVTAPFTAVAPPATITALSPAGNFQAVTTTSGSTQYYQVYGP